MAGSRPQVRQGLAAPPPRQEEVADPLNPLLGESSRPSGFEGPISEGAGGTVALHGTQECSPEALPIRVNQVTHADYLSGTVTLSNGMEK